VAADNALPSESSSPMPPPMSWPDIRVLSTDNAELDALLGDHLYEFNVSATGIGDGKILWAAITDDSGATIAGLAGHTWGGCCEIVRLWVDGLHRAKGLGSALMLAAETEARERGCAQIVLSTHSFQAPAFYEKLGFRRIASIPDYPKGYEQLYYRKDLAVPLDV
jgi:ribosomal protein S18 acetylase RimI-like enzyme